MSTKLPEFADKKLPVVARFGKRTLAWIMDCTLLAFINYFLNSSFSEDPSKPNPLLVWVNIFIAWQYEALGFSSASQTTLGKRVLNLKVTDEDGNRISYGRATKRHFAKYLSAFTLLIGFLMALFTEKSQTLHDKLAKTIVLDHH